MAKKKKEKGHPKGSPTSQRPETHQDDNEKRLRTPHGCKNAILSLRHSGDRGEPGVDNHDYTQHYQSNERPKRSWIRGYKPFERFSRNHDC
jgi:hypothetical protein